MKNAHNLPPLFMWKEREFIMVNNNLKEKIKMLERVEEKVNSKIYIGG